MSDELSDDYRLEAENHHSSRFLDLFRLRRASLLLLMRLQDTRRRLDPYPPLLDIHVRHVHLELRNYKET